MLYCFQIMCILTVFWLPDNQDRFYYDYFGDRPRDVAMEHELRVRHLRKLRFKLRSTLNPFAISVTEFVHLYRIR